jgi:hypothetical protein
MPITTECFQSWSTQALNRADLDEIDYRTIISRSYYSAYHSALRYAEADLQIPVRSFGGSTHQKLSELLISYKCDDEERQKAIHRLGSRISALHSIRIKADYFLDEIVYLGEAKSMVKNTSEIIENISAATRESAA